MGHHADITTGARAIVMGHNGRARSTFMETNNRGPLWTTWSRSVASGPVEGPVGRQFAGPGAGTRPVGHTCTAHMAINNNRGPLWTTWSRSVASGPVEGPVGRQFAGPGAGTKPVGHARTAGVPNHLLKRRANDALLQEYV